MRHERWPRQHAKEMLKLKTLEERRKYLETRVPKDWVDLVKAHVKFMWSKR